MLRHGVIAAGVEQHLPALWRAAGDALRHAASAAPCAASTRADAPGGSDASTSSTGAGSLATPAHRTPWRAWQRRRDAAQWRGFASGAGGSGSSDGVSLDDSAVQVRMHSTPLPAYVNGPATHMACARMQPALPHGWM